MMFIFDVLTVFQTTTKTQSLSIQSCSEKETLERKKKSIFEAEDFNVTKPQHTKPFENTLDNGKRQIDLRTHWLQNFSESHGKKEIKQK